MDLSNTYLNWAQRNFHLNQINNAEHQLIRADVFLYLQQAIAKQKCFDLIVMDPPSFSNSKKMLDVLDVQRNHIKLIDAAMQLLSADGTLFFSNNLRGFELDSTIEQLYQVVDVTKRSIPEDFRNQKIHQCWEICHKKSI